MRECIITARRRHSPSEVGWCVFSSASAFFYRETYWVLEPYSHHTRMEQEMRFPSLSRTRQYCTVLVTLSHRRKRAVRCLVTGLISGLFLIGFLLPCFPLGQNGNHVHTRLHSASHEHHHRESPAFPSEPSHPQKQETPLCCHDSFQAAFYGMTRAGKAVLSNADSPKQRHRLFSCSFSVSPLNIVPYTPGESRRARAIFLFMPTPTLYALHTSLLL